MILKKYSKSFGNIYLVKLKNKHKLTIIKSGILGPKPAEF